MLLSGPHPKRGLYSPPSHPGVCSSAGVGGRGLVWSRLCCLAVCVTCTTSHQVKDNVVMVGVALCGLACDDVDVCVTRVIKSKTMFLLNKSATNKVMTPSSDTIHLLKPKTFVH